MTFVIAPIRPTPFRRPMAGFAGALALALAIASSAWAGPKVVVVESANLEQGEVEPGQLQKFEWTLRNDGDAMLR